MASQHFPTNLQQEVTCPICLEILQNPVTIDCGHSFCHSCITRLKEASKDFFKCPLCKSCMNKDSFSPSWLLGNLVERIRAMDPSEMQQEGEQLRCPKHGEKLHYFCKSDGELLCLVCHESKEHRFHNTSLIEEAAKHYQEQIQRHVGVLEQKEQGLVHMKAQGEEKISNFMAQVEFEKQRIQTEFKHLQQVLEEEKSIILSSIKELANNGAKESERYSAATKVQLSSLKDFKDSLKDKQRMPPIELLEDIKGTLHRSEGFQSQFHTVSSIPMDLERKISKAKSRHDSIIKSLKKFGEQLQAEKKKHRSKILSEMSVSLWQNRFLLEINNPNADRSSQPEPTSPGDPTDNPGSSSLHPPAQFQPQSGSRFEVTESGSELNLLPGGAPENTAEVDTGNTYSCISPSSSFKLKQGLTPVTLDVASAHSGLNISQDLKMVTADVITQNSSEDEVKHQHF